MARDRANIRTDMLADDDFRKLSMPAQHLYMILLIHPTLTYAGVADWRAGRLAALTAGSSRSQIEAAAGELQKAHFIYVDEETEEVLIRSFVRHDGLLKQYRLPVSMANDYAGIASSRIRAFFAHELKRLNRENPTEKCWEDTRVAKILTAPAEDMKGGPQADHSADTLPIGFGDGYAIGYAEATPKPMPSATTTATTTSTSPSGEGVQGERKRPERKLPATWAPNDAHKAYAETRSLDFPAETERFKLHAAANDRRLRDWDAGFRMWLTKAVPATPKTASPWSPEFHQQNRSRA